VEDTRVLNQITTQHSTYPTINIGAHSERGIGSKPDQLEEPKRKHGASDENYA
jgi:hypothetical protein